MTYRATCRVASLNPAIRVPPLALRDSLEGYFAEASRVFGDPAIRLTIDKSKPSPVVARGPVSAFQLHLALRRLTSNPTVRGPVPRIGLLFADSYAAFPHTFGIMFDRGFKTTDDDTNAFDEDYAVPREGCAVFMGTIAKLRKGPDLDVEAVYTAIHELGHVFNLIHADGAGTFMATSESDKPNPRNFGFSDEQKRWLSRCGASSAVTPGGDPFVDLHPTNRAAVVEDDALEVEIRLDRNEVWNIEPVELQVRLSVRTGDQGIRVPHEIDPGYARFNIWIEDPSGARQRYRPMRHYCSPQRWLTIAPRRPFQRDVTIHAQSGGYTFRQPGEHRVWVELARGRKRLRSNVERLYIRPWDRHAAALDILAAPRQARILYHRWAQPNAKGLVALSQFAAKHPRLAVTAAVRYALGRALAGGAERAAHKEARRSLSRRAQRELERAHDCAALGDNARRHAKAHLEELRSL